ncbi:MAG: hypothetical protein KF764_19215 [Labilithrix sp.]|nr:hypothetical protein [Labilithrix sp.]MBX3222463.1 hypothetical protein [Labilithrix sp.]
MVAPRSLFALGLVFTLAGCASSAERKGFDETKPPAGNDDTPAPTPTGDFGTEPPPEAPELPEVHEVFGQSATTLYKLEPATKAVTVVGDFKNCERIIDIALDEKSTLYAVSDNTLYTVDKTTAACTKLHSGNYPNSLSFVPKGTLDANEEALVGYDGGDYVRIDVNDGTRTVVGKLGGNLVSSGDIASVKGGKTFLTVKGGSCNTYDCLVEIDPTTGKLVKNWGSVEHKKVFGLSFWGGNVYGFDEQGNLFEVVFGSNKIVTTTIPIPQKPAGLSFWGAGSSTSAPLVAEPQ